MRLFILCVLLAQATVFSTALGDAVALMNERSWRAVYASGDADFRTGSANPIFIYSNDAAWDPATEKIMYVGSPHAQPWNMIIYTASNNEWHNGPLHSQINSIHSYDCITIKQSTGTMYYWPNHDPTLKFNAATDQWSTVASGTPVGVTYGSALDYFPERDALVHVGGGTVGLFSLRTNSWSTLATGVSMGGYHNLAEYNPVHKVMILGGGNGSRQMHKLGATGGLTPLRQTPFEIGINTGLLTCDPVSGKYLYLTDNGLYAWDIMADTWDSLSRNPYNPVNLSGDYHMAAVVVPINTYGVVAFMSTYQHAFLLYKYANPTKVEAAPKAEEVAGAITCTPNPVNTAVKIAVSGQRIADSNIEIAIYDTKGKIIYRLSATSYQLTTGITWSTAGLPAGVYVIRAVAGNRSYSRKVLVAR